MDTQWVINALAEGSLYLLIGLGFGLVYRTVRFFDFSFAALLCIAPYSFVACERITSGGAVIAGVCCVFTTVVAAGSFETVCFAPLRRQDVSPTTPLLVSLGLFLITQNCVSAIFGDQAILPIRGNPREGLLVLGGRITIPQLCTIVAAGIGAVCVGLLINRTKVGRCIRSVGDDRILAKVVGVSEAKVVFVVMALAAISASAAGLSIAFDVGMTPNVGFRPFLMAVVAVIMAGSFSIGKIATASYFVAAVQHFAGWRLGTQWQEAVIFAVFVAVVVVRSKSNRWKSHLEG